MISKEQKLGFKRQRMRAEAPLGPIMGLFVRFPTFCKNGSDNTTFLEFLSQAGQLGPICLQLWDLSVKEKDLGSLGSPVGPVVSLVIVFWGRGVRPGSGGGRAGPWLGKQCSM